MCHSSEEYGAEEEPPLWVVASVSQAVAAVPPVPADAPTAESDRVFCKRRCGERERERDFSAEGGIQTRHELRERENCPHQTLVADGFA